MVNGEDIKKMCETIFTFKANAYASSLEQTEQTPGAFRESISRFFIELYSILDTCSKDLPSEEERNLFWDLAESSIWKSSNRWLDELSSHSSFVRENREAMSSNMREFQKRAVKFHKERQRLSQMYRQQLSTTP